MRNENLEPIFTKELKFEKVIDPNYNNHKNFAILKLTEDSAKRYSSSFVATPLGAYNADDPNYDEASKDASELLDKGYCLVANIENVRRTLESFPRENSLDS